MNVTNMNIANNLVEKISELLEGEAHHFECVDRTKRWRKIEIIYDVKNKDADATTD